MLSPALLDAVDARIKAQRQAVPGTQQQPQAQPPQWYDVGPLGLIGSAGNGINKAILETGDLIPDLAGQPDWMDQNVPLWRDYRMAVERRDGALGDASNPYAVANSITSGLSQFATGMVGATKVLAPAKAIMQATTAGRIGYEMTRGALVSFVAMDPHEERLSNLILQTPLANPITEWLAAPPRTAAFGAFSEEAKAEQKMRAAFEAQYGPEVAAWLTLEAKAVKLSRQGREQEARALLIEAERLRAATQQAEDASQ